MTAPIPPVEPTPPFEPTPPTEPTLPTAPTPPTKPTPPAHKGEQTLPTGATLPTGPTGETAPTDETNPGCGPQDSPDAHALYTLPTTEVLEKAFKLDVLDKDGVKKNFGELCKDGTDGVERNLVIFIRHWFCGVCQSYIKALTASLPPPTLASLTPPVRLTIIGCGSPSLITQYIKEVSCSYPLYTDPTQTLYKTFNLGRTMEMGEKAPDYIKGHSMWSLSWGGVKQYLKTGLKARGGGDWAQIGGEFLFVKKGEGWEVEWAHRMRNTRDHAEVKELKEVLGVGVDEVKGEEKGKEAV